MSAMAMLQQLRLPAIIVPKRCANGHSTELVLLWEHSHCRHRHVSSLPNGPPQDRCVAGACVYGLLSAVLLRWHRELAAGAARLVRAFARTFGVGELHAFSKDERHSSWRNMVACTVA